MKRIIVTGGLGFIGSNYIRYMLDKYPDLKILNIDACTYASNQKNLDLRSDNHCADIRDFDEMRRAIRHWKPDAIVNFAAETHVDRSIDGPEVFLETNILGVKSLLDAIVAVDEEIVFHQISTDEVYGSLLIHEERDWVESDPYLPNSPYSASKASAEHFVRAYGSTYGVKWLITNCSNNFGPRCHPEKFIPKAITNLLTGKKVPVYGNGWNMRDWIYVEDHCSALDVVLHSRTYGEKYNIGGAEAPVTNLRVVGLICNILNLVLDDHVEFVPDRPGHDQKYSISSKKIHTVTGWTPKTGLIDGLVKTVNWYDQNRDWWQK